MSADALAGNGTADPVEVATSTGEQAIGTTQVGEQVWAYNPRTSETLHTNKKLSLADLATASCWVLWRSRSKARLPTTYSYTLLE